MMFAQYCRIESLAGGVSCTPREFIKACHSVLQKRYRFGIHARTVRTGRHAWIRSGLEMRLRARQEYSDVMGG